MFVAIQMIGRYVQDQRNFRTEMDNALQLKTAQLQNENFLGVGGTFSLNDQMAKSRPDVAATIWFVLSAFKNLR